MRYLPCDKSKEVIENINKSNNKILYSLAYNANCNSIENFFSQLKNYVKNKSLKYKNL